MDNMFFDFDTEYGATYTGVTGVVTYSYGEFKLNPRSEEDLAGYAAGSGGESLAIVDIQQNGHVGPAKLEGVIVSAPMADEGFWVQDPGGGEWSGLYVYTDRVDGEVSVSVGDVLDITGEVSEYYDLTEISVGNTNDIEPTGTTAEATAVSLSEAPADWENYEGVLVSLSNVEIGAGGEYGVFLLNYSGLSIDDEIYNYNLSSGDTMETLTGVIHYTYGEFKIYPRSAEDMSGAGNNGGGEPSSEPSGEPSEEPGPTESATIMSLQDGTVSIGSSVLVEGVIVTGVSDNGQRITVQDPTATEYAGIMLYISSADATVSIGDEVSVSGVLEDYFGRTNIEVAAGADILASGSTGTITPVMMTQDPADWEVYEGMLVSLGSATVNSEPDPQYKTCTLAEYSISLDDGLVDYTSSVTNGTTYTSIVGVVDEYYGWVLLPRSGADFVQ